MTSVDDEKRDGKDMVHHEMPQCADDATLQMVRKADPGLKLWSARGMKFIFYVLMVCMCTGDTGETLLLPLWADRRI